MLSITPSYPSPSDEEGGPIFRSVRRTSKEFQTENEIRIDTCHCKAGSSLQEEFHRAATDSATLSLPSRSYGQGLPVGIHGKVLGADTRVAGGVTCVTKKLYLEVVMFSSQNDKAHRRPYNDFQACFR